jgi:SRSO17 transposase
MIARAIAARMPFTWVAADTVYGVGEIARDLRRVGKGYVLGVSSARWFGSWNRTRPFGGSAEDIAETLQPSDWQRLSAGAVREPKGRGRTTGATWNSRILRLKSSTRKIIACGHAAC